MLFAGELILIGTLQEFIFYPMMQDMLPIVEVMMLNMRMSCCRVWGVSLVIALPRKFPSLRIKILYRRRYNRHSYI